MRKSRSMGLMAVAAIAPAILVCAGCAAPGPGADQVALGVTPGLVRPSQDFLDAFGADALAEPGWEASRNDGRFAVAPGPEVLHQRAVVWTRERTRTTDGRAREHSSTDRRSIRVTR